MAEPRATPVRAEIDPERGTYTRKRETLLASDAGPKDLP